MPIKPRISIHAPAWGATKVRKIYLPATPISIHAPAWGATPFTCLYTHQIRNFNPRTRVGCDGTSYTYVKLVEISIHAPAWGATIMSLLISRL